ncbi:alpha/beta hydrolase [Diaphorobacter sp.]|uniref:alpha/beta fold hydrolase n=1 Tax=Diaphorobacter sp. TaxID=1934310 RepID=UPI0028B1B06F|nr:alpha/beta hydrolase [Diaphorobacter sp.]
MTAASRYVSCAGYELHYMDWGAPDAPVVIAWHGLARTGRDMDALAAFLVEHGWRVICPDTIGRGFSQWSRAPRDEYCLRFYARLARALFDTLDIRRAHWIGTSMGGAIGTVCASGMFEPDMRERIVSLVLNDNAPELAAPAIERIKAYAGQPPVFDSMAQLEKFFRTAYAPFGWLSDAEWRKLAETSMRRLPDGRVTPHYDPAITQQFTEHADDYLIWPHYDALDLPVLLLRGVDSDLVLKEVAQQMRTRGPGAQGRLQWLEIPNCGHAPALNVPEQWQPILQHLSAAQTAQTAHG